MSKRKRKRKLTAAQKREQREGKENFMTVFINGKQKRVRRPPTIDGMDVDDYILANADPLWYHLNGMWECIPIEEADESVAGQLAREPRDDDLPF